MLWDESHLKALLRIYRFPFRLIQEEPWHGWIAAHGGTRSVYAYLRSCHLAPHQRDMLEIILEHPNVSAQTYADFLNISRSTYFNQFNELLLVLLEQLNSWDVPATPLRPAISPAEEPSRPESQPLPASLMHSNEHTALERAAYLSKAGTLAYWQGDYNAAWSCCAESLVLYRAAGEMTHVADLLGVLGNLALSAGRFDAARLLLQESLQIYQSRGDSTAAAGRLCNLGMVDLYVGNLSEARLRFEHSLDLQRQAGNPTGSAVAMLNVGLVALFEDRLAEAQTLIEESRHIFTEQDVGWGIAHALLNLAKVTLQQGDLALAESQLLLAIERFQVRNERQGLAYCLELLAEIGLARGQITSTVQLWGAAEALREAIGRPLPKIDRRRYDRLVANVRSRQDEASFIAAWAQGRTLPLDQLLTLPVGGGPSGDDSGGTPSSQEWPSGSGPEQHPPQDYQAQRQLTQLLQSWQDALRNDLTPATIYRYRSAIQQFLAWCEQSNGRPFLLADLDRSSLHSYRETLLDSESIGSANTQISALRNWCDWLSRKGYLTNNPAQTLSTIGRQEPGEIQTLTPEQVAALTAQLEQTRYPARNMAILHTLLSTGMRIGECSELCWQDLTLTGAGCTITLRTPRRLGEARLSLSQPLLAALTAYAAPLLGVAPTLEAVAAAWPSPQAPRRPLWISERGMPLSVREISRTLHELIQHCAAAGLLPPGITPHSLRHTFAVRYLEQHPADLGGLAQILGVRSLERVKLYLHAVAVATPS